MISELLEENETLWDEVEYLRWQNDLLKDDLYDALDCWFAVRHALQELKSQ